MLTRVLYLRVLFWEETRSCLFVYHLLSRARGIVYRRREILRVEVRDRGGRRGGLGDPPVASGARTSAADAAYRQVRSASQHFVLPSIRTLHAHAGVQELGACLHRVLFSGIPPSKSFFSSSFVGSTFAV